MATKQHNGIGQSYNEGTTRRRLLLPRAALGNCVGAQGVGNSSGLTRQHFDLCSRQPVHACSAYITHTHTATQGFGNRPASLFHGKKGTLTESTQMGTFLTTCLSSAGNCLKAKRQDRRKINYVSF